MLVPCLCDYNNHRLMTWFYLCSHETIEKSVQVLNDAYDLAMIDFRFAGYSYTYQDEWFAADWAAPENK